MYMSKLSGEKLNSCQNFFDQFTTQLVTAPPLPTGTTPTDGRRLQRLDVIYTTPTLGLTLGLRNETAIFVKQLDTNAPNANIVRPNDLLVGVNGKRFEEIGWNVTDKANFQNTLEKLRAVQRPMMVAFERLITVNAPMVVGQRTSNTNGRVAGSASMGAVPHQATAASISARASQLAAYQQATKKRKAQPEVIDLLDDDEIQIEETLSNEQAIRKRVREAEEKGEVVEIN